MNSNLSEANELYKKSQAVSGVSRPVKRGCLEKAIVLYRKEIAKVTPEDSPSLHKNLGLANYRLADVLDSKIDLLLVIYHLAEAVKAFTTACVMKAVEKDTKWRERLDELISECFEKSYRTLSGQMDKFYLLDQLLKAIGDGREYDTFRERCHLANGQYYFNCGVKIMEGRDYRTTIKLVEYARQEYEKAMQCAHSKENKETFLLVISGLHDDISFLSNLCDSIRLREQADHLFDTYMQPEEKNFEMIWNALDMYKASEIHSRNVDIENEAIAISRQGRIFYKVFNMQSKAHTYYRASFDLAATLHPKDMTKCEWFKECKIVLEQIQKAKLKEEEAKKQQERAEHLVKMKKTLAALEANSNQSIKLLKYIYQKHPPKGKFDFDAKKLNSNTTKKALMQAIIHYHPDKQVEYDMEWRILSEEITKCLTVRYEQFKG